MTQAEIEQAIARLETMAMEAEISSRTLPQQGSFSGMVGRWAGGMRDALACLRDYIPHEDRELAITVARQVEQAELLGIDAGAHLHETRRLLKLEPQP